MLLDRIDGCGQGFLPANVLIDHETRHGVKDGSAEPGQGNQMPQAEFVVLSQRDRAGLFQLVHANHSSDRVYFRREG